MNPAEGGLPAGPGERDRTMSVIAKAGTYTAALLAAASCAWALGVVVRGAGDEPRPQAIEAAAPKPAPALPGAPAPSPPPAVTTTSPPDAVTSVPRVAPGAGHGTVNPYPPAGFPAPAPGALPLPAPISTVPTPIVTPVPSQPVPTSAPVEPSMPPTSEPTGPAPSPEPAPACEGLLAALLCAVTGLLGNI